MTAHEITNNIVGKGSKARRIRIPDTCASMLKKYINADQTGIGIPLL